MRRSRRVFVPKPIYVSQLSKAEKLELYKKIKGWCAFEGCWNLNVMKNILDEKVKDIMNILEYDVYIDCMEYYNDYVNGR